MSDFGRPQVLSEHHDLSRFACGKPVLDKWLKEHALDKQKAMLSRTYVVEREGLVVGFFTLALVEIRQEEAPARMVRGMPSRIPAILMAKFAIDSSCQGIGLGRSMFLDALRRAWSTMVDGPAPARLFAVDAIDEEAMGFYRRFDMKVGSVNPTRLFLVYKDLKLLFERA